METVPPHSTISVEQIPGRPLVQEAKPEPCAIVIFGITGDLAKRKLVPALYNLLVDGAMPERFAIVGLTRGSDTPEQQRDNFRATTADFGRRKSVDPEAWRKFADALDFVHGKIDDPKAYADLKER